MFLLNIILVVILNTRADAVQNADQNIQYILDQLNNMKTNLQSANERIETIENELGNEISDLKEELKILKQQHSTCQQPQPVKSELVNLRTNKVFKRGGLPLTALFNGTIAAFSATLTHDVILNENEAISFDKILSNEGNAYDSRSGQFVAPVRGLYLLSISILNKKQQEQAIELVKNGIQIVSLYGDPSGFNMASQTVVILLEKNDKIWVRRYRFPGSATLIGRPNELYNTFSGVLLYEI